MALDSKTNLFSCDETRLPLKAAEEDEEEKQEATVGLADANEISVDAAVVAVSAERDGTSH